MSGKSSDGQIDQLVKARWLALGLSPNDLAEVLGAPSQPAPKPGNGAGRADVGRLMQVADALGVSHDLFQGLAPAVRKPDYATSESATCGTTTDSEASDRRAAPSFSSARTTAEASTTITE